MLRFEIADGIAIEVEDDSELARIFGVVAYVKKHIEFLETHSYEENDGYDWTVLSRLVDETWNTEWHELIYGLYNELDFVESRVYREYSEADFLEYASHKNEDGFDWDFYSDWHKDIYGFRPRA